MFAPDADRDAFPELPPAAACPVRADGTRYGSYVDALVALTPYRPTYRLHEADLATSRPRLVLGRGRYFDGIGVGDVCAHEYAAMRLGIADSLPARTQVGDPCDPARRPTNIAVSTLTIRRGRTEEETSFLLHWRDPAKVGHAGGLHQVLPAGIFQPSGEAAWNEDNDFDLWRTMVREFAEEVLGASEEYGSESAPIDYDGWPFAADITAARADGRVRAFCLGLGVDPLTLAVDLLTVTVIDAATYDTLFGEAVRTNAEGTVTSRPFNARTIAEYSTGQPMQAAGAALLRLAWEHREALIGTPAPS